MRETTNLGLKITEGSDDWRDIFDDNADNMDVLDEAVTKDASTTSAGRVNTGEQEFAGTKTFTGLKSKNTMNVHGANSANYNVRLSGAPTDSGADGLIGIFSAMYSNLKSWLTMKVYGVNSQGKRINYYDEYKLPETAADKSANNTYDILTTKAVTLDASSQAAARRNISAVRDADVAIMANGNTHAAIASGQAVLVRNHSSLSDGLYWASTAIATNATLSTSNLTADTSGGLNKLKGDIDSLNSNFMTNGAYSRPAWLTDAESGSDGGVSVCYNSKVISVDVLTANISHAVDQVIGTIPEGYRPLYNANFVGYCNGSPCVVRIKSDGNIVIWHMANPATGRLYFHARYFYA